MVFSAFLTWLQTTRVATTVNASVLLTGAISSIHLVGFTLIMGAAVVSNLRLLGILFPQRPPQEVANPASRGILIGLLISVSTGLLLFAPRAPTAGENGIFQTKMLFLIAAATFQFMWQRHALKRSSIDNNLLRVTGAIGLALWVGVALAGCAYILLE